MTGPRPDFAAWRRLVATLLIALALLFSATAFAQGLVKTDSVVGKGGS